MKLIYIATEDALSEAVADRIILDTNNRIEVSVRIGRKGNTYLKNKFINLIDISYKIPVFLITDLDKISCPLELIHKWSQGRKLPSGMIFRIAVREIEAWLLADRKGFSKFTGIPTIKIPNNPEILDDPKQILLNLVHRFGKKEIKSELLPATGSTAKIGFGYNSVLSHFVKNQWSVERASQSSDSLNRTINRIRQLFS
jgi:hypothetical protein